MSLLLRRKALLEALGDSEHEGDAQYFWGIRGTYNILASNDYLTSSVTQSHESAYVSILGVSPEGTASILFDRAVANVPFHSTRVTDSITSSNAGLGWNLIVSNKSGRIPNPWPSNTSLSGSVIVATGTISDKTQTTLYFNENNAPGKGQSRIGKLVGSGSLSTSILFSCSQHLSKAPGPGTGAVCSSDGKYVVFCVGPGSGSGQICYYSCDFGATWQALFAQSSSNAKGSHVVKMSENGKVTTVLNRSTQEYWVSNDYLQSFNQFSLDPSNGAFPYLDSIAVSGNGKKLFSGRSSRSDANATSSVWLSTDYGNSWQLQCTITPPKLSTYMNFHHLVDILPSRTGKKVYICGYTSLTQGYYSVLVSQDMGQTFTSGSSHWNGYYAFSNTFRPVGTNWK